MINRIKPRIGLVIGDPCGIGPELIAQLVARPAIQEMADIVIVADPQIFKIGEEVAGITTDCRLVDAVSEETFTSQPLLLTTPSIGKNTFSTGKVSKAAGHYQLDCLAKALELCKETILDGLCFAPLNKEAMHLAGLIHEDELGFFRDQLGHVGELGILNTLGSLWTSRATSHVSHRQVSDLISRDSVLSAIRLLDTTVRASGINEPRIAVAGLNPHAGDGGTFGDEEIKAIEPAVKQAKLEKINAAGPFPADTIFLRGKAGEYDAIVTMYHDQGQIAMKLMGFDSGVTVHAGLPFPVTTSAHGSAFDIAGKGVASANSLKAAFTLACSMAATKMTTAV